MWEKCHMIHRRTRNVMIIMMQKMTLMIKCWCKIVNSCLRYARSLCTCRVVNSIMKRANAFTCTAAFSCTAALEDTVCISMYRGQDGYELWATNQLGFSLQWWDVGKSEVFGSQSNRPTLAMLVAGLWQLTCTIKRFEPANMLLRKDMGMSILNQYKTKKYWN